MLSTQRRRLVACATWLCLNSAAMAAGTGQPGSSAPEFPGDPSAWINSGPVSLSALKGKATFLWFFEEGCPVCRKRWPELLTTAKAYAGKPVVFIGVNSGNSRESIAAYAKEVGCDWPILVDSTREYERLILDREISMSNIYQARIIGARGTLDFGNWNDLPGTIDRGLQGASWKIEPTEIPESLKSAWLNVEFGNYPAAASLVKKSLLSKKADVKEGAEKIKAVIQADIDAQVALAKDELGHGHKWQAFQIYTQLGQSYKGFDLPTEVTDAKKQLTADPAIKDELIAFKSLDKTKKIMASERPNSRKTATTMLEKLVREQGDTAAGTEAKKLLDYLRAGSPAESQ